MECLRACRLFHHFPGLIVSGIFAIILISKDRAHRQISHSRYLNLGLWCDSFWMALRLILMPNMRSGHNNKLK